MRTAEGGFASSLDADSEGEEGKFYVWSLEQVRRTLGPADAAPYAAGDSAAFFAAEYDVSAAGNFEGHNILNRINGLPDIPAHGERLAMLRSMLQHERDRRVRPGLDDKVLADWNGLTIATLAHGATALSTPDWLDLARAAFGFVARSMSRGSRLGHSWRDGKLLLPGLASDYAAMIRAALALFEATGEPPFLETAVRWQHSLDTHYADAEHGGYYLTADDAEGADRPAALQRRRRDPESHWIDRAKSGAARGADRRQSMADPNRRAVRHAAAARRRKCLRASVAAQRAGPASWWPRDRRGRRGRSGRCVAGRRTTIAACDLHRAARTARRGAVTNTSGAREARRDRERRRLCLPRAELFVAGDGAGGVGAVGDEQKRVARMSEATSGEPRTERLAPDIASLIRATTLK